MQKRSWWDYIFQRYRRETVDGISKMNVGFSLSRPECGWRTNLNVGGSLSRPKFGRESEPPTFVFVCTGLHTVRESEHEPSCPDGYMDGRSWMSEVHFPGRVFSFWLPLIACLVSMDARSMFTFSKSFGRSCIMTQMLNFWIPWVRRIDYLMMRIFYIRFKTRHQKPTPYQWGWTELPSSFLPLFGTSLLFSTRKRASKKNHGQRGNQ